MRKVFILLLLTPFIAQSQSLDTTGYILSIDNNKIYLDLHKPNVEVGSVLKVVEEGGFFEHPVTGKKIKKKDEIISNLEVIDVEDGYSIATAYPPSSISLLQKGMKVFIMNQTERENETFKKSIAVQPLNVTSAQGGSFLGLYIADLLTEELFKRDKFKVVDRQTLGFQTEEAALSQAGVFSGNQPPEAIKIAGVDYFIVGTVHEPDVVETSTGIPVKGVLSLAELATGKDLGSGYVSDVEFKQLKAIVKITLRVVDAKSGEIKFICTEMAQAEGRSEINLERGALGGLKLRGGATSFTNTVTGMATKQALDNLSEYIMDYFDGKIDAQNFRGNVIETGSVRKPTNNNLPDIKVESIENRSGGKIYKLNKGENANVTKGETYRVVIPKYKSSIVDTAKIHDGFQKVGLIKIEEVSKDYSYGIAKKQINLTDEELLKQAIIKPKKIPFYGQILTNVYILDFDDAILPIAVGFRWYPEHKGKYSKLFLSPNLGVEPIFGGIDLYYNLSIGYSVFGNLSSSTSGNIVVELSHTKVYYSNHYTNSGVTDTQTLLPGVNFEFRYKNFLVRSGLNLSSFEWHSWSSNDEGVTRKWTRTNRNGFTLCAGIGVLF